MAWTSAAIISEIIFVIIAAIFILVGVKALRDDQLADRIPTAIFWFVLAFIFSFGPHLPNWVTGALILVLTVISAFKKVKPSKNDVPLDSEVRAAADRIGFKIFIPALSLAFVSVLVAMLLTVQVGVNNAIGVAAAVALILAFVITKAPAKRAVSEGTRLMDTVGPVGILPQLLAALGALFTAAGVGDVIAGGVSAIIPDGSRLIAVIVYCAGMALFTMIMGNGFAAFSVITVGIGYPFLIMQGANPVVVGALGLTAGYCGTLMTPMAANFNIMPAALLETKDNYVIIKSQVPVALSMLVIHMILMYTLAF